MGLGHHHHHHHHHHMGSGDHSSRSNLALAFFVNLAFAIIEFIGGIWTGSVAIASEAIHDFGDSVSLGAALWLEILAEKKSNHKFSYGYRRLSLLSSVLTGVVLVLGSIYILYQAIPRLWSPVQPMTEGMVGLAFLGIMVNGYAAWRVNRGKTLNERMISWHLLEDLMGWVLLLIVSVIMHFVNAPILDPILSIVFTLFILSGVLGVVRKAFGLFMQATPDEIDLKILSGLIREIEEVDEVHDMHCWSLDGESHVITLHVVVHEDINLQQCDHLKQKIRERLGAHGKFHVTVEVEMKDTTCPEQDCVTFT